MNFVKVPNLPHNNVSLALVDGRINKDTEKGLLRQGIKLIKTCPFPKVYEAISFHPDVCFHHIGDNSIVHAPGVDAEVLKNLSGMGFRLIQGETELSPQYPYDIAYNAARVGSFVIHNLKYTDKVLRAELEKREVKFIHVKQGYAKCSIAVVDSTSIITSDKGIARAAEKEGIEVLLVEPEKDILLPGLDMGFFGGSTGQLGSKRFAVSGCFEKLKSKEIIKQFLENKGIHIISLSNGPVVDIGSILPILEE